ncbi:MAG: hypothetical protein ACON4T_04675 [Synechococcus sp.]
MAEGKPVDAALVKSLVERVFARYGASPSDLERMCWTVVHDHHHGAMPTEYDIREVDEDLYLAVLESCRR